MKAAVYRKYGPPSVVQIEDVPTPVPAARDVLVKIKASTVSSADSRMRSLKVPKGFGPFMRPALGLFKPRKMILGSELAGEVVAVGEAVTKFKIGDRVFAFPGFGLGSHAEYRTMPEDGRIELMPAGLSFEEAAAISFGGTTALHFLRDLAKVERNDKVLIIGASGAVGSAAVQIAKHLGAEVTAVTSSANVARMRELKADHVIDYTAGSYLGTGQTYDVIFETVGSVGYPECRTSLTDKGRLVLAAASLPQILHASWVSVTGKHKAMAGNTPERVEDVRYLRELVVAGKFRPVIDRSYAFDQIVAAHEYVDTGRKRGNVVIVM